MKKRRLALLCVVALLGGSLWWAASRSPKSEFLASFTLRDSNRVHLVAVTAGSNSSLNFGSPVERVLGRLPGKLGQHFNGNVSHSVGDPRKGETLIFWFVYDRPPPNDTWLHPRLLEDGNDLHTGTFASGPQSLPNGKTISHSGTHQWPRRHKTLTLRLNQSGPPGENERNCGEVTISNPAERTYPEWKPETLPSTKDFTNVSFILESAPTRHGVRLRVASDGKPNTQWVAWRRQVRDATGNLHSSDFDDRRRALFGESDHLGRMVLPATWFGMPKESAWKLGVQFVRTGHVRSNEIFVLRGVPATSPIGPQIWTTNAAGCVVSFLHDRDWEDGSSKPCLRIWEEGIDFANPAANPPAIMILGAVNDQGDQIEPAGRTKIHIPLGSATLDVTIAVLPQYFVEYTVDAKAALTADALVQPLSTPAFLEIPESIRPEKILRELNK